MTAGGIWMGDFREGVLWRYDPTTEILQRVVQRRAARHRRARRPGLCSGGRQHLLGLVARYDAATGGRIDSIDVLACALASGDGVVWAAGCPYAERLSTDGQRLRKLRDLSCPSRPGHRVYLARPVSRAGDRRRLTVGARRRARPTCVATGRP